MVRRPCLIKSPIRRACSFRNAASAGLLADCGYESRCKAGLVKVKIKCAKVPIKICMHCARMCRFETQPTYSARMTQAQADDQAQAVDDFAALLKGSTPPPALPSEWL